MGNADDAKTKKEGFVMFYKRILTISVIAAICLLGIGLLPVHGEAEIYDKVVRLHVLANSNSEEDQAVKLEVRDAILGVTVPLLENCQSKEEAVLLLEENQPLIIQTAQTVLQENGFEDAVSIEETGSNADDFAATCGHTAGSCAHHTVCATAEYQAVASFCHGK